MAINKRIALQSVNGPALSTIQGYPVPGATNGDGAVRCVYMTNNSTLIGFTVTQGATRAAGDLVLEQSGGAVFCADNSAVISNCLLTANSATYGGGILAKVDAIPLRTSSDEFNDRAVSSCVLALSFWPLWNRARP